MHRVDPDAELAEFLCGRAGDAADAELAGAVGGHARRAREALDRGDVDDRSPPPAAVIGLITFLTPSHSPIRFTSMTRRNSARVMSIGFAFPDYASVWKAMDGELGAYVRGQIAKTNQILAMETIWDNGFRQTTTSTKPITTPDDFRGMKLRVPVSLLWTSMFKALGASPASINFNEVYSALQTKIVDGQENPLAIISTAKLYEVQKYCSMTNHMWDGYWFLANRRAWEALPDDVRTIAAKHFNAAGAKEREDVAELNATLQQDLTTKGLVFNKPDHAPFREKLRAAGFYTEWKAKYGDEAWAILEKSAGKLP